MLESEVVKPLLLWLLDPEEIAVPAEQLTKALDVVESWFVRRMLVRATTKNYNLAIADLITQARKMDRSRAGDVIEDYLRSQPGVARYWPDDAELIRELPLLLAYRRLRRGRLRMVLEAIEDYRRGWVGESTALGGERVTRHQYAIEHVMPQRWQTHWPLPTGSDDDAERDRLVQTLGNLTLLTHKLNSGVSNGKWGGITGKRVALHEHDVLFLNRDLLEAAGEDWTDEKIRVRAARLAEMVTKIWTVPEGHKSLFGGEVKRARRRLDLSDLIGAGMLEPGMTLYSRRRRLAGRTATLLPDGRIDVDSEIYDTPSVAATAMAGRNANGWGFFLVDSETRRSLRDVYQTYMEQVSDDVEDDELTDDEDEDG